MSQVPASEFESSVGAVLRKVPAGRFVMGSPDSEAGHRVWEQQREVVFENEFFLGSTPVTQEQYAAVIGNNPTDHAHVQDAPVDSLSWDQANEYCEQLTKLDLEAAILPGGWHYRLPTEAEWEYACRAGTREPWHGRLEDVAWFHTNSGQKPHAVGQKLPNTWGFHDMHGNLWEWCQDWFCVANPSRSVRGGSYFNSGRYCRSSQRWGWMPNNHGRYCGLRLLAAPVGPYHLTPPIDDFPQQERPPTIYDAMEANDFQLAQQVVEADRAAVEWVDAIPPPVHWCIYQDQPEWLAWLLEHGADVERLDQDYGATALTAAVVCRNTRSIRVLVERGAETRGMLARARNGLAGGYEDSGFDREGYQEVVDTLVSLGVEQ